MIKQILLLLLFVSFLSSITGQVRAVRKSQFQKIEQKVGITDVIIEYYRPSMKGRKVFGEMEPMGETWRTGANRNSKITFSNKVTIKGVEVEAGTYAVFTRPDVNSWEVYFYDELTNWDVPELLDEKKIVAKVTVVPEVLTRTIETLTMNIDDLRESTASLSIMWENTRIAVPIEFHTNELMSEFIDETLSGNRVDFHIAAVYLRDHDMDLDRAKALMEKAIVLSDGKSFQDYLEMSRILYKMNDVKGAITAAERSLELAIENKKQWAIEENQSALKKWRSE